MYVNFFKPLLDFMLALLLLLLALPVMLFIALVLLFSNNGQVFYAQPRPGLHGRIFKLYKFATMTDTLDAEGRVRPGYEKASPFGKWLRTTSLNELPQLVNVLKGELSLVGPRPLLPDYLPLYSPEQMKRHLVKPGITGLAQVNGRNALPWPQRFAYDLEYVQKVSFVLDLKILAVTVIKVLKREGTEEHEEKPIERFKGNRDAS
jgi:lipopolysaccharide/colanic/teichoic acid biosynthesis glycosyltransferase